jgi:hypothetical protein
MPWFAGKLYAGFQLSRENAPTSRAVWESFCRSCRLAQKEGQRRAYSQARALGRRIWIALPQLSSYEPRHESGVLSFCR